MKKQILFCGEKATVVCDEKCHKAWGWNSRPMDDNGEYLPDKLLNIAPIDPKTYEGGDSKPVFDFEKGNKWCVRECERCAITEIGKPHQELELPVF